MKKTKIAYWISTGILVIFLVPGIFFINSEMAIKGMQALGLPDWFRYELSIAKPIGAILLILPFVSARIKEWIYVALAIDFISAIIGHIWGDKMYNYAGMAAVFFIILIISYVTFHQLNDYKTQTKNY